MNDSNDFGFIRDPQVREFISDLNTKSSADIRTMDKNALVSKTELVLMDLMAELTTDTPEIDRIKEVSKLRDGILRVKVLSEGEPIEHRLKVIENLANQWIRAKDMLLEREDQIPWK
jgi:hypothetical protein